MLIEMIEIASTIIGTGAISSAISYRFGKNKGIKEAPKPQPNLEKELKEVEEFLDPFKKTKTVDEEKPILGDFLGDFYIANQQTELKIAKPKILPIHAWKWERWKSDVNKGGVRCPKCAFGISVDQANHPPYCECIVDSGHFHLTCRVCKFEAIYETEDTTRKKQIKKISNTVGYTCAHCQGDHLGINCPSHPFHPLKTKLNKKKKKQPTKTKAL